MYKVDIVKPSSPILHFAVLFFSANAFVIISFLCILPETVLCTCKHIPACVISFGNELKHAMHTSNPALKLTPLKSLSFRKQCSPPLFLSEFSIYLSMQCPDTTCFFSFRLWFWVTVTFLTLFSTLRTESLLEIAYISKCVT